MEGPGEGAALGDQLAGVVGRDRFDLWLTGDARLAYTAGTDGGVIDVVFSSGFLCDTARRNIGRDLTAAAQRLFGNQTKVVFRVDDAATQGEPPVPRPARSNAAGSPANHLGKGTSNGQAASGRPAPTSSGKFTFESLVVGKSNQLAARAAEQLAAGLHVGGPLVIWGPPGCGKTHLLSAIRHRYRERHRRGRVLLLSSEQFVGHYVDALRGGGLPSFRQKYRAADLLLIDDLHFLAGKRATLEELQHTIDRVTAAGGRVAVASCREPARLAKLGDELASRLAGGLACEVTAADYATRLEIARRKFESYGISVDSAALASLAAGISTGAREMLGAVERLRARHELLGEAIDTALVDQTVREVNSQTIRPMAMDDIQKAVCDYFGVEAKALRSDSRSKSVTEPRMLAMWLARKYTQAGWREIGEYFGGRRHSTVISAHRRIEAQMGRENTIARSGRRCNLDEAVGQIESALRMA